ncbi:MULTISPECIES: hypothetical protein [unclassified Streptomyces]|uniref:hypothetical protein n=1 Tax=unclassified Streptomyces TaxID=2593676 RepID=UPI00336A3BF6
MKRGLTTAVAAVAIMAGAAGCTSGGSDGSDGAARGGAQNIAAKRACADGTYTWLNVSRRPVVNAMAVTTQKSGHKVSTRGVEPVARYTVSVRTEGAALSGKQVIRGLARHLKPTRGDAFTLVDQTGRTTTYDKHGSYGVQTAKTSGRYVTATAYDLFEADFRYVCGDDTVSSGHVVSWDPTEAEIILECGEKLPEEAGDDSREAARLGCHEGDPARA